MPAFAKNPKVIVGTIVILWLIYVIYANFQLDPIQIKLLPFAANVQLKVSAVILGAAIFGSGATFLVQWFWRRRSSKKASAPEDASSKTVA